jgi:hypothetical protein
MTNALGESGLAELRQVLRELEGRIERQQKRIDKAMTTAAVHYTGKSDSNHRVLPAAAERSVLAALMEKRDLVRAEIAKIEAR